MNNLQINFLSIFSLSLWLIPNLLNVTLPFILIFGLVLSFLKFDKDREIIAMYSLGLSINELKKPIIFTGCIVLFIYLFTNFIFSPLTYSIYKENEFKLRNSIDFNKINIANFIELDNKIVIDFNKKDGNFEEILINFQNEDNEENIIYAKKGIIDAQEKKLVFILSKGFKLILNENEIEQLRFDNYKIEFPNIAKSKYKNWDKNTLSIFDLLKNNNNQNREILIQRIFDILIIISFILYFYFFIIKSNNYSLKNLLFFIFSAIFILTIHNFITNINMNYNLILLLNVFNLFCIHLLGFILHNIRFYE